MKKITKILTFAIAFVCLSLCFAGCVFDGKPTLDSIAINGSIQTQYAKNEALNLNDAKLVLVYSDDSQKEIKILTSMVSGFDTTTAGNKTMTITYKGKTTTVNYVVSEVELEVSSISIKTDFCTNYLLGDTLDTSGGKLLVTYSNDSTEVVNIDNSMITDFTTSNIGKKQLTLTYKGKEIKVEYNVHMNYGEYYLQSDGHNIYAYSETKILLIINEDFTGTVITQKNESVSIFDVSNRNYVNLTWKFANDSIEITMSVSGQTKNAIIMINGDKLSMLDSGNTSIFAFKG